MGKTIKVIGCAGAVALLICLLPLCLLRNEATPPGEGHPDGAQPVVSAVSAQPGEVNTETGRQRLVRLHRQKRYLLFPEGSSFQLVFDIIIPIIDYTNYAILGITCSVAWELPSKPASEIIENVLTRINDGTIGTVRRNGSAPDPDPDPNPKPNLDQENREAANWQAMHALTSSPSNPSAYATNGHGYYTNIQRQPSSYTYSYSSSSYPYANGQNAANAYSDANANGQQRQAPLPANWHARQSLPKWQRLQGVRGSGGAAGGGSASWRGAGTNNWWTRNKERVQQGWREKQRLWSPSKWDSGYSQRPRQILKAPPKHHIYPVFARRRRRRSLEQDPQFERLTLQQHIKSRQLLFGKIERLYKSQRLNGTSCVQRALCESAQRQRRLRGQDTLQPQSFIMELLSAIFQLPHGEDLDDAQEVELLIPPHYWEAHRQQDNCQKLYGDCAHTFWMDK
ncbi:hypothetical protein KR018_002871 [Drosophila ironensis]|nr:hypothetical protein KR018_002871 [Drosophila ironensis]